VSLRHQSVDAWPTRDRILYEASRLIATRGFHGATTREIADGVGIKQPSVFNHFASKQAILEELLDFDLTVPADRAQALSSEMGSAALRLYRYALWDLRWYQEMPFDLRGMHEDLASLPGLERFQRALEDWTHAIDRILDQGLESGEFRADAVPYTSSMLVTLSWEFVRSAHKEAAEDGHRLVVEDGASFILRGLLVDPEQLSIIQAQASDQHSKGQG
jgi:AcrR family transcriptional regulator